MNIEKHIEALAKTYFVSDDAKKTLRIAATRAAQQEANFLAEDKLHQSLKLIRRKGKPVYFSSPVNRRNSVYIGRGGFQRVDEWKGVTSAKFHAYQPRKKMIWLQLKPSDLKNGQYGDNLQPLSLVDAVELGLSLERPGKEVTQ